MPGRRSRRSLFCCPFVNGDKQNMVDGIKKLNELTVFIVAVYVLIEFRGIPYGCSSQLKNNCLDQFLANGGAPGACFFRTNDLLDPCR